jgi:predicted DCC family thiol-disulfide oxidoreductase YuxK
LLPKATMAGRSGNPPVLVFDGDCGFCTSVALHFERRSRTPVQAVPWQRAELASLGLTPAMTAEQVYLVSDGSLFAGAECFAELMKIQDDPFHRVVASLMRAPGLRRAFAWGYRVVARNRHRLPGGTPACKMD